MMLSFVVSCLAIDFVCFAPQAPLTAKQRESEPDRYMFKV